MGFTTEWLYDIVLVMCYFLRVVVVCSTFHSGVPDAMGEHDACCPDWFAATTVLWMIFSTLLATGTPRERCPLLDTDEKAA